MANSCILIILDGWGITKDKSFSAIDAAYTPTIDRLYREYPHTVLQASGKAVGLPYGQVGNSEVGHIHIGAGRVIAQNLLRIDTAIQNKTFHSSSTLLEAMQYAKRYQKSLHLMGLVSNGGVHAHIDHLKQLCFLAHQQGLSKVFIHAFTDGRDTAPHTAMHFLHMLEQCLSQTTGKLATIIGRYYAMDRDHRWKRTQKAYQALVHGQGNLTSHWPSAIQQYYKKGLTDEFFFPLVLTDHRQQPIVKMKSGDVLIGFNFRNDRMQQIMTVLTHKAYPAQGMQPLDLQCYTFTNYHEQYKAKVIFKKKKVTQTLGEVLSIHKKKQIRIAETEKYPHVTYFFSGGREIPFVGEDRYLCPSPKVATYDLQPEMSAFDITKKTLAILQRRYHDFICVNFANPDMVGHTGHWQATVQACAVVDQCVGKIILLAQKMGYIPLIIADHGNADQMLYADGSIHTSHTNHLVPCILVKDTDQKIMPGCLTHVAPTILQLMQCPSSSLMENSLLL